MNYFVIFSTILVYSLCDAYRILLVFPFPSKSHSILGDGFAKHLLRAGHQVTLITATPMEKSLEGLRTIDLSSNYKLVPTDLLNLTNILNHESELDDFDLGLSIIIMTTITTLMHENVQALLHDQKEKFDVVIAEWMYSEIYAGFGPVFNCPFIWSSSVDPHNLVLSLIDEDVNPAYIPNMLSFEIPPFTFKQRVYELWRNYRIKYAIWKTWHTQEEAYKNAFASAAAKRGAVLPPVEDAVYNASLLFGNSHYTIGSSVRLPQNYIHIAGFHIDDEVKPLPKNLKVIMDNATNGVIYFSLGSIVKSEEMPDDLKTGLLDTFRGFKQTVIWKFEGQLPNVPENVHIVSWAPQPSILAHPNCVLFISHGGLLSITESIHYGVPLIGIPVFGDQFNNVNKVFAKGFGKRVDISMDMPEKLKTAIKELLDNPSYRERMKEINFIHHHRLMAPGKEIAHWVEHVVRTRGAQHLRSPSLDMPLYQKMYLDLLALILVIIASVLIHLLKMFTYFKVKTLVLTLKYVHIFKRSIKLLKKKLN